MHTETFALKTPVYEFTANGITGFKINFDAIVRNPTTKAKEPQRYLVVVFAASDNEADYYRRNLIENVIVTVSAKEQIITQDRDGNFQIQMTYASIDKIFNPDGIKKAPIRTNYGRMIRPVDHDERERQRAHAMESEYD